MNLEVHTCLLTRNHDPHEWWYTSEGGGHQISNPKFADATATVKGWYCLGKNIKEVTKNSGRTRAYSKVKTQRVTCDLGHNHQQDVYQVKVLFDTGRKAEQDNGYYKYLGRIYVDVQGREYQQLENFDNGSHFYKRNDDVYFSKRFTAGAIDVLGRRL